MPNHAAVSSSHSHPQQRLRTGQSWQRQPTRGGKTSRTCAPRRKSAPRRGGHPWLSFFSLDEIRGLAEEAGFAEVTLVTADDLADRYFTERDDDLRPSSSSAYLIATL
jgi:hypothetical protein